jgi:hypothetical protein
MALTEFRLHLWSRVPGNKIPTTRIDAASNLQGAAMALHEFIRLGYDITAPGAHIDVEAVAGHPHTVSITEVLDWLRLPAQADFVARENLQSLLEIPS